MVPAFSLCRMELIRHAWANSSWRAFMARMHPHDCGVRSIFFIIFIDPIFTVFVAPLFTKLFDSWFHYNLPACLSHACNAD